MKWNFLDIDECSEGSHDCHDNATCTDAEGSFICTCNTGFTGSGTNCQGESGIIKLGLNWQPLAQVYSN